MVTGSAPVVGHESSRPGRCWGVLGGSGLVATLGQDVSLDGTQAAYLGALESKAWANQMGLAPSSRTT